MLGEEVDGVLLDGLGRARRELGPVEAALAVDVGGDVGLAHERAVGARRDRHVGAAGELEHAQRVVGRLLERLVAVRVVTPTSSISGLASASRSAIASSCPGSQSRMTGVVTAASMRVDLADGRQGRLGAEA